MFHKEKPNKDRRLIQDWRSVSLFNVDQKIVSRALVARLNKVLLFLISPGQTTKVDGRFIGESGRLLIADTLETTNLENMEGYLLWTLSEKQNEKKF